MLSQAAGYSKMCPLQVLQEHLYAKEGENSDKSRKLKVNQEIKHTEISG